LLFIIFVLYSIHRKPAAYYNQVAVKGEIITTESLEQFKKMDKNVLIREKFSLENVEKEPESLARFLILTYAVSIFMVKTDSKLEELAISLFLLDSVFSRFLFCRT